jgi:hypothetical protein
LGLAADLGRALAHVHNLEIELFEEAGRPTYDAGATRARLLSDLDRAAATGHVPTGLLSRWEHALEDVSLWRFLPTPVHGSLVGANVLASFDDEDDADSGRIRAITGWEESHVGDPADDFADLAARATPDALDSVLQAYAPSRIDRPDHNLLERARLGAELRLTRRLLRALAAEERGLVEEAAAELRALEQHVYAEEARRAHEQARPRPRRPLLSETENNGHLARAEAVEAVGSVKAVGPVAATVRGSGEEPTPGVEAGSAAEPATTESEEAADPRPRQGPRMAPAHLDTVAVPQAARDLAATEGVARSGSSSSATGDDVLPQPEPATEQVHRPLEGATRHADQGNSEAAVEAPSGPALHFEIDEAEPLPPSALPPSARAAQHDDAGAADPDDGGVLDLHEGASEFVPVERRHRPPESSVGS